MAGNVAVWGIDVGRSAMKAVRLRAAGEGKVEIAAQEYVEHPTILSRAGADQHKYIVAALEQLLSRNDLSKDKVVVGVPGQHTLARFSKLPPVEPKKIPDIVRYEADQQIPFDLDDVIWDYQTFQEEGSPDVEVGIFAMKRELIRDYLLPFDQLDIEPIVVQSSPLALYNSLHYEGRLGEETSVLLDVGAENTDLIVATGHGLWTRTIPLGGNRFTDALVKAFKLSFAKAEGLKKTAATSKYARQVFQAMRPVFAELVQELSRSLGFYRSTHRDASLKRIIGLGNAFELPGLRKYLQQNLQMPVERPDTFKKTTIGEVREAEAFGKRLPSYMVAHGLALEGLEFAKSASNVSEIKSNLLPPEIVKHVVWRRKQPFFAASAACLLLAAGIIWFRYKSDMGTLAAGEGQGVGTVSYERAKQILATGPGGGPPRQVARTVLAAYEAIDKESKKYRNQGVEEAQKSAKLVKLQENKALWPKILAAIHGALPEPPAPLAGATTAEEYAAAVHSNDALGVRQRRGQIFVERFESAYEPDIDKVDLLDIVEPTIPEVIKKTGSEPRPGFLITLRCRTPKAESDASTIRFVADTIKAGLRRTGRKPGAGFYINRVALTEGHKFGETPDDSSGSGSGGRGRGRGRGAPAPKSRSGDERYDPVTEESMMDDWVFELKFDVVLADLPEPEGSNDDSA